MKRFRYRVMWGTIWRWADDGAEMDGIVCALLGEGAELAAIKIEAVPVMSASREMAQLMPAYRRLIRKLRKDKEAER